MNGKIIVFALLVILVASATAFMIIAPFGEKLPIKRIVANHNEENSNQIALLGDPRDGGWPCAPGSV